MGNEVIGNKGSASQASIEDIKDIITSYRILQDCDDATEWSEGNAQTANLADTTEHTWGTGAITFDKVAGGTTAYVESTIDSADLCSYKSGDLVLADMYMSDVTDVNYAFIRLGTDASNYQEWQFEASLITAGGWSVFFSMLNRDLASVVGNGWDSCAVTYVSFGVAFNGAGDTLAGIILDNVGIGTLPGFFGALATILGAQLQYTFGMFNKLPYLGAAAMAASQPVTMATDQTPIPTRPGAAGAGYTAGGDTNFVTGDSPVTIDVNTALGRNGNQGFFANYGAGALSIKISASGAVTGEDAIVIPPGGSMDLGGLDIDQIEITWIADTAYSYMVQ